jgi:hypothetical protein
MKILLDQHGIQFMVAIVPVFPSSATDFGSYGLVPIHAEIRRFLDEKRILKADLLDSFLRQGGSPQSHSHDIYHPNKSCHAVIAQGLLQPILSELRAPGPEITILPLSMYRRASLQDLWVVIFCCESLWRVILVSLSSRFLEG